MERRYQLVLASYQCPLPLTLSLGMAAFWKNGYGMGAPGNHRHKWSLAKASVPKSDTEMEGLVALKAHMAQQAPQWGPVD